MIALKLKNITVQHANCLPVLNIAGFPAITSFTGFANAIAYKYGLKNSQITIISNGCELEVGFVKYGQYNTNRISGINTYLNSSSKKDIALSMQPNVIGRLELSLYVYFDESIRKQLNEDIISGKLKHELLTKHRISGGVIVNIEEISIIEDNFIEDIRKNHKFGYFVCDERQELSDVEGNLIKIALEKIHENELKNQKEKSSDCILSLTSLGYYLMESPNEKIGSREDKLHAYAEPLTGMISFRKIKSFNFEEQELPIWEMVKVQNMFVTIN